VVTVSLKVLCELYSINNIRQGETPQSERLARERLDLIGLEFRLPKDVMEYVLPFLNCTFYTTTSDNCQIVVMHPRQRAKSVV